MGRYYSTMCGRDGKFGVGTQPSTDPGDVFEMQEQEPNTITYYLESNDESKKMVKAKIDKFYDELEVPQEERIYYLNHKDRADENKLYDLCSKYAYLKVNRAEVKRYNKRDGYDHREYYCEEKHKVLIERKKGLPLCVSRIHLGLTILSDLQDEELCELTAEL